MLGKSLRQLSLAAVTAVALSACVTIGNAKKPIATILVPATEPAAERTLIVVLPGFGSDAEDLKDHKIGDAVHKSWPQADVLLTSATIAYYARRNLVERLHNEIITTAREQGYQRILLAGASVGGMGVLLYEHAYPGEMDGVVLLAPWLGSKDMLEEIRKAGGIREWQPGPVPETVNDDNYQHELWRVVKNWSEDSASAKRVWMACGTDDRMLPGVRLLAPAIPASHTLELPGGGHNWDTFVTATDWVITQIRKESASASTARNPDSF